jgi:hypothetical protein
MLNFMASWRETNRTELSMMSGILQFFPLVLISSDPRIFYESNILQGDMSKDDATPAEHSVRHPTECPVGCEGLGRRKKIKEELK